MNKPSTIAAPADIVIGKDVIELVSSAMYVDPLTIYREYVQNAADAIDEAKEKGVLDAKTPGRIDITLDLVERRAVVRDNGGGVPNNVFTRRLTALGGSNKRGTAARGLRGIGRLAALGYCQELIFRSRAEGDRFVQELRWDGRIFKRLLQDHTYQGSIRDLVQEIATISKIPGEGWPEHFFEVELVKPIRIRNDLLLNRQAIGAYLAETACVPFAPDFELGTKITDFLIQHIDLGEIRIFIDGSDEPIYRPYRNSYAYGDGKRDAFTEAEFRTIDGPNGKLAAVAWLAHHGYHGAIPPGEGVAGLRARKGNIQVGDGRIFADVFPEARFASWTVGEVHIIDDRVIPNGRRDEFEQNAHYGHLTTQLTPIGDKIARLCRHSSVARNRLKTFDVGANKVQEQLAILEQGAVAEKAATTLIQDIRSELHEIKRVTNANVLQDSDRIRLEARYTQLENRLHKIEKTDDNPAIVIRNVSDPERKTIQRMVALIYECSQNRVAAKLLVDRILAKLGAEYSA